MQKREKGNSKRERKLMSGENKQVKKGKMKKRQFSEVQLIATEIGMYLFQTYLQSNVLN